jgi:molybdopterin converting factor subunit 1
MNITVHLFARARDLAGRETLTLEVPPATTVGELRRIIAQAHPALAAILARCALAVNQDFAPDTATLSDRAEVAVLPPVSGG